MNAQGSEMGTARGSGLIKSGQRFARKPGPIARFFARVMAPGLRKILDHIDAGLERGSLTGHLPNGATRVMGGRGDGFHVEVTLHDWRGLLRLGLQGSIGWYQAWEAGEWESDDPVSLFALFMDNGETLGATARASGPFRWAAAFAHWLNRNSKSGSARNIHAHYDLGNDFYAEWLDATMSYSSAIFDGNSAENLELAQQRKWAHLARRLANPESADAPKSLLEIGCGWGALSDYFARGGSDVTAISLSDAQLQWARAHNSDQVDFRNQDYRDTNGQFDAIVSVEMVEAVGREYWPSFFDCIARNLKSGGRAAIQYIWIKDELFDAYAASADFIQAYIFPGGLLISNAEFEQLAQERDLTWQDRDDFALDYAETLKIWRERFDLAITEGRLPQGFDAHFQNLWRYYLMYCEGGFRGGGIGVSQVTLEKKI